jgi:hypothetical protein
LLLPVRAAPEVNGLHLVPVLFDAPCNAAPLVPENIMLCDSAVRDVIWDTVHAIPE